MKKNQTGSAGGDYKGRIDTARSRIGNQEQGMEQLQELLEQAVSLLETLSTHPAIRDYDSNKRKLDEIEQRLNQSGNVF